MALVVFFASMAGVIGLLILKHVENSRGKLVFSQTRREFDYHAHELKLLLMRYKDESAHMAPFASRVARILIREAALFLARLARRLEKASHSVADLASHKRHFERKETRSEFLREMKTPNRESTSAEA